MTPSDYRILILIIFFLCYLIQNITAIYLLVVFTKKQFDKNNSKDIKQILIEVGALHPITMSLFKYSTFTIALILIGGYVIKLFLSH